MASLSRSHEISIHLMLLLNEKKKIRKDEILDFNTSYVVIKQRNLRNIFQMVTISIHLMLLLNYLVLF